MKTLVRIRKVEELVAAMPLFNVDEVSTDGNGSITSATLSDHDGNTLKMCVDSYSLSLYGNSPPVLKYQVVGTIDGIKINQVFDDKYSADCQLQKFTEIVDPEHRDQVKLEVKEIRV